MARRANDREAAARTAGAETIRLSRFRVAGDDRTVSRGRGSRPVPADGRTGVDLLARRPSHILDRLQESAGGGHELGVRISGPQPPTANHHDPAGRCPQHPGLRGPGAPGGGWRTSKCPMTALSGPVRACPRSKPATVMAGRVRKPPRTLMRYDSSVASDASPADDGLSAFERARPRLFGIAYRMLGSVAEAEDVVQDVWTR